MKAGKKKKGLLKYKDKWGTPEQVRRWKEIEIGFDKNFAHLSPYEFEEFIAQLFRKMGYTTTTTPYSGDFGADVIAKKKNETILIQCKRYAEGTNITPEEVQRTLGAMWKYKADKAVFITTSHFSTRAAELDKEAPIELWNKDILHQMVRKYFINEEIRINSTNNKLNNSRIDPYILIEKTQKYRCEYCLANGKYHYCKTLNGIKRHVQSEHI